MAPPTVRYDFRDDIELRVTTVNVGPDMANSVRDWLAALQQGDPHAAQQFWEQYAEKLVQIARNRLADAPRRLLDEEDIVQSVFGSICRGAAAGRFANLQSRDELWWLLLTITKQKTVNYFRKETAQKRGSGKVRSLQDAGSNSSDRVVPSMDDLIGPALSPDFLVALDEEYQYLLRLLRDDVLRRVAIARVEGYTVGEIAEQLAISRRAVERKLQLIRSRWAAQLSGALD